MMRKYTEGIHDESRVSTAVTRYPGKRRRGICKTGCRALRTPDAIPDGCKHFHVRPFSLKIPRSPPYFILNNAVSFTRQT